MLRQSLVGISGVSRELTAALAAVSRIIAKLDALIKQTLQKLPEARDAARQIAAIPGFGVLSSTYLGYSFTRLPYSSGDAVVAQSGLDPRPNDSGKQHGRRRLSKRGPSEERRLLFNCAMSAPALAPLLPGATCEGLKLHRRACCTRSQDAAGRVRRIQTQPDV